MEVERFSFTDVVMHCDKDVAVTPRNVTFGPGVASDHYIFKIIQEEGHCIESLDLTGAHINDGGVFIRDNMFGDNVEAAKATRQAQTQAVSEAVPIQVGNVAWVLTILPFPWATPTMLFYMKLLFKWASR